MALQLPRQGHSGLYVFAPSNSTEDEDRAQNGGAAAEEKEKDPAEDLVSYFDGFTRTLHPYEPGKLVLHSGHSIHQIAPSHYAERSDARITLQCHAIRAADGVWKVYW